MVVADGGQGVLEAGHRPDDDGPHGRVVADDGVLLFGQLARLAEDLVGDADLADVVQQGGNRDGVPRGLVHLQSGSDLEAEEHDVLGVLAGVTVLVVHGGHQSVEHREALDREGEGSAQALGRVVVTSTGLGTVQAAVGQGQGIQSSRRLRGEDRRPDRQLQRDGNVLARREVGQGVQARLDALGQPGCLRLVQARQQQGELVATEPGQRVPRAAAGPQGRRDLPQHVVAREVPVGVVEELEVVQVHQGDRQRRPRPRRPAGVFLQALVEDAVVQQAGQTVLLGQGGQVMAGLFQLDDALLEVGNQALDGDGLPHYHQHDQQGGADDDARLQRLVAAVQTRVHEQDADGGHKGVGQQRPPEQRESGVLVLRGGADRATGQAGGQPD